jgi:hypothetical protein
MTPSPDDQAVDLFRECIRSTIPVYFLLTAKANNKRAMFNRQSSADCVTQAGE